VLCWFNEKENSSITLNSKEILFGGAIDNDTKMKKLNLSSMPNSTFISRKSTNVHVIGMFLGFYVENRRFRLVQFVLYFLQSKKKNRAKFLSSQLR